MVLALGSRSLVMLVAACAVNAVSVVSPASAQDGATAALSVAKTPGANASDLSSSVSPDDRQQRAREAFTQAQHAYARGDLASARTHLARARELLPSPELAYDLARVHERMGDTEAASTLYREYMELGNPTERERAQIDRSIEELAALHARRQEALKAAPPDASLLGQEARAMFELGVTAYRARRAARRAEGAAGGRVATAWQLASASRAAR
jgi:tetratricopeptide (TPR) repeat protein